VTARWRALGAWDGGTLLDHLDDAVRSHADEVAIVDGEERLTLGALAARAAGAATALGRAGVGPGDVVCAQLPNWWEAVVVAWAVLRTGAVLSPLTPTLRERELGVVFAQTRARLHVTAASFRGVDGEALARRAGFEGEVWTVRGGADGRGPDLTRAASAPPARVGAADPAVVLWTSGTTSVPKGVVHTHQGLRHEASGIAGAHAMSRGEALLLPMPVTHVAGLTYGVLLPVTHGIRAVLMDVWDAARGVALIEQEQVAVMISTPVFMRQMLDVADFDRHDVSSIRLFSLGGAGVAPSMVREGASRFGPPGRGCWCKRTYGSTEYPTLSTGAPGDDPSDDATSDGRLIGLGEARVVDAHGHDRPPGEPGELWARGPEMFSGYLDAALDAESFAPGGWFRTGDVALLDGDRLTIVDRLKDVIIRGGENVSALEVEGLLVTHPAIAEAACVAAPDRVMGERVCAFVIVREGCAAPSLAEVVAHLRAQGLAPFKLPERLEIRAALPRTESGKVQKEPLRAEAARSDA
jgi:cyclohexanecarboxylate-CoA ligase